MLTKNILRIGKVPLMRKVLHVIIDYKIPVWHRFRNRNYSAEIMSITLV